MLKTIPLLLETMQCPINKTSKEIAWSLKLEKLKNNENFQKPEKNANFTKSKNR